VGGRVDLDQVDRAVRGADQPEAAVPDDQAADVLVELLEVGVDLPVLLCRTEPDPEAGRADLRDGDPVRGAAQLQVDWAPDLVSGLGPAAVRGGEEVQPLGLLLLLIRLDSGGDQRNPGVPFGLEPTLAADPVDPPGVGAAVDDLGLVEQFEQEALVRRAALDQDGGVSQRPPQPGASLLTRAPMGDDLGDHRVEVRGDQVTLAHAGVDPDARAGGKVEQHDAPGRRCEVTVRVLGVQPRLDGVPHLGRALTLEPAAQATCSCALTRSNPVVSSVIGCSTCSRVFTSRNAKLFSPGGRGTRQCRAAVATARASRSADP
jgi:hypothetical protein